MAIKVRIPTPLRTFTKGLDEVEVAGDTVRAALDDLERSYAGIKDRICDDKGVRRFVNIFLNEEDDIRFLDGLDTKVKAGDSLQIVRRDRRRPMSALRYARQFALAEIGTTGQARLEAASVRAGGGDARALEVALLYLERAGVKVGPAGEALEVASTDEVARVAGRPDLREAAAFLCGALAATERLARIAEAPARPPTRLPSLVG